MIRRLRGRIWEKQAGFIVLDVGGVGYELQVAPSTAAAVGEVGSEADLHVWTHLREEGIQLFGFAQPHERMVFELLLGVSGIGPKMALAVLSGMTPADLVAAVSEGDVVRLTRAPGIGKKTAERLVVELRDKIDPLRAVVGAPVSSARADALAALIALGYPRPVAERALQSVGPEAATVQDLIKAALLKLSDR